MSVHWLFDVDTYRWSTQDVAGYSAVIIPDSFSGIDMRWTVGNSGIIAPSQVSFSVLDVNNAISLESVENETCIVKLMDSATILRQWKFTVKYVQRAYGKLNIECVDFLQEYLFADYPNTLRPKEVWHSDDTDEENSTYRIPVVLGSAYIPVESVNTGVERLYVLGKSGSYTITEVRTPSNWPVNAKWGIDYTYTYSTDSGYSLAQLLIHDSNLDGTPDANGLWKSGESFLRPVIQFTESSTVSTTNPADWIEFLLKDFGIDAANIDVAGTFNTAKATYTARGLAFNGGFYQSENRESLLNSILNQCDSFLYVSDKIELHTFSKASKETFSKNKILKDSFKASSVSRQSTDSGRIEWQAPDRPQHEPVGKAVVPSYFGQVSIEKTEGSAFVCRFIQDSIDAQKAGILYYNKQLCFKYNVNFQSSLLSMTTLGSLKPGHVITVNDPLFGGKCDLLVTMIAINSDLQIAIDGLRYDNLQDWDDISPSVIDVVADNSTVMFPLGTNGKNAYTLRLIASSQTFTLDKDLIATPSSITLEAVQQNFDEDVIFDIESGSAVLSGSGNTRVLDYSDMNTDSVHIKISSDAPAGAGTVTLVDHVTISKVHSGVDGAEGANGVDGTNGEDGAGLTYRGTWIGGTSYIGTSYVRDVVLYSDVYYICQQSHTSSKKPDTNPTFWQPFGAVFESVATGLLLANDAAITRSLLVGGGSGDNTVGMSGDGSNDDTVRLWAGGDRTTAPFRVTQSGELIATDASLSGSLSTNSSDGVVINSGGEISLYDVEGIKRGVIRPLSGDNGIEILANAGVGMTVAARLLAGNLRVPNLMPTSPSSNIGGQGSSFHFNNVFAKQVRNTDGVLSLYGTDVRLGTIMGNSPTSLVVKDYVDSASENVQVCLRMNELDLSNSENTVLYTVQDEQRLFIDEIDLYFTESDSPSGSPQIDMGTIREGESTLILDGQAVSLGHYQTRQRGIDPEMSTFISATNIQVKVRTSISSGTLKVQPIIKGYLLTGGAHNVPIPDPDPGTDPYVPPPIITDSGLISAMIWGDLYWLMEFEGSVETRRHTTYIWNHWHIN